MSGPHDGIDFSGIISYSAAQPTPTLLPLESLEANVLIADISARVVLTQVYSHSERVSLREAHYVFPIPASAAVCSFDLRTNDGRRLKGVVKDLSQAKEDYEKALSEGRLASLLQQFRQDVFVIFIGTIPPRTEITVNISYVLGLPEDDEADSVRFQLSSHVGARYGAPPTSSLYHGTAHRARLRIGVDVEMPSRISQVISLTHPNGQRIELRTPKYSRSLPDDHYACWQIISEDTFLDRDFLLVVQAPGLDKPRCLAESLVPGNTPQTYSGENPTTALALAVVPRFDLPVLKSQEYIFLIDRSGSMSGQKIEVAKQSLVFLLRTLPATGTTFNIFSFGSTSECLWPRSEQYNQATLWQATRSVDIMRADLGGTQLFEALAWIFMTRSRTIPTSVFVLTDGEIFQPQETIASVRNAVSSAPNSAPLRLFTLGVGHGASTALCEGIANAGNGACSMTLEVDDLMLKSARLVNAMRVATVKELTVDWGVSGQVLQTPSQILNLSPGVRLLVTAIIPKEQTPARVILRGRLADDHPFEYTVPVKFLSHRTSPSIAGLSRRHPPLLHTLAAHRHIRELEGGQSPPGRNLLGLSPATKKLVLKALIVEIGTRYQVASEHTAFVAIDEPHQTRHSDPPANSCGRKRDTKTETINGDVTGVDSKAQDNESSRTSKAHSEEFKGPHAPGDASRSNGSHTSKRSRSGGEISKSSQAHKGNSGISQAHGSNSHGPPASKRGSDETRSPRGDPGASKASKRDSNDSHTPSDFRASAAKSNGSGSDYNLDRKPKKSKDHSPERLSLSPHNGNIGTDGTQPLVGRFNPSSSSVGPSDYPPLDKAENPGVELPPEIFTHEPPVGSPQEVMCFPDPLGGVPQVIMCIAPPLLQISVPPPRRKFWSWLSRPFRRVQPEAEAQKTRRGFFGLGSISAPSRLSKDSTNELWAYSRLQEINGSFSLSPALSSLVKLPESQLHSMIPLSLASSPECNAVWATAIAVAFLRIKFPLQSEIWEPLEDKAIKFGSSKCTRSIFDDAVHQAMELLR